MIQKPKRPTPAHEQQTKTSRRPAAPQPATVARLLLDWYADNRRPLPWRAHNDPYAIWVSEVMLQQTQVATVAPYFQRWLRSFPTLEALAEASEDDVLHHWQGLGYYSRARSLHAGAKAVLARGGSLPRSAEELRALPGIGPYTAGAIASIAFGLDEPLVDGNVMRVLTRLYALPGDPRKSALGKELWRLARSLLPRGRAGDFNQALMELGAIRCTPKKPLCDQCPLKTHCVARRLDQVERFPELGTRVKATAVEHVAALATRRGQLLLSRLPADAPRWGGLWLFPTVELTPGESAQAGVRRALKEHARLTGTPVNAAHSVKHAVTRYRVHLTLWRCTDLKGRCQPGPSSAEVRWLALGRLDEVAMPSAQRKLATWLHQQAE